MNRTGLIIAALCALGVGLVFGIYPELDLRLVAPFAEKRDITFAYRGDLTLYIVREATIWVSAILAIPAAIALIAKLVFPRARALMPSRAALFMLITLALGPGLLVNVILKEHWARPRPIDVTQFGGTEHFVAWWDPRGDCRENCSFVSGDAAGAFWTLAPAALVPPTYRPIAYAAAIAFGFGVGLLRMMFGGHFFSDVFFAGFFTFVVIWLCYALMYRWRATAISDAATEADLERLSLWFSAAFRRVFQRRSGSGSRTP